MSPCIDSAHSISTVHCMNNVYITDTKMKMKRPCAIKYYKVHSSAVVVAS